MPTHKKYIKWLMAILVLAAALLASAIVGLSVGELKLSLADVWRMLVHGGEADSMEYLLISQVRLPRVILGIAVGGALSLAGVVLQGIYRNPLVEPFTLGISGGASLGVAFTIVTGLHLAFGSFMLPLFGFIGAFVIIFLVYTLSTRRGSINIQNMLLTGVMISFIASSAMMFLMATTSSDNLHGIVFWIMGSLDEPDTGLIYFTLIAGLVVLGISYLFVQPLNALRLGEEKAMHLGFNTNVVIRVMFLLASLLAGICVSVAGVIGFVGLIIPHVLRLMFGHDYRILLIGSFLLGGIFLVLSDVVARTIISPNELPIGVITGIVGGLVFLVLMSQKRKGN
ncbi:FecCD family ABC transporter permease [Sunxiuqinia elliptica]|uniref:Iron complex transport system permease protein n=1 Tax=Sunxiuqinia elliptica TaxID=655355 RepID=A0A1I2BJ12_9BACT|nr:iron ABC transporter permease [Sunxiuqinia elliptica]SFE56161.1 iron complex transport system permease protein [Sunxiuqinia elliptica]